MSSFIRFACFAAVVFSLGLIASALPVYANVHPPTGSDLVSKLFIKLCVEGEIEAKVKALLLCANIEDLKAKIAVVAALLKVCAEDLLHIGAGVAVDLNAKASIVACVASIITLCVQVFVSLSLKFGLAICVEIDVVLRMLLVNLNICVDGILVLIAKALASVTVGLLAQVNLKLCLSVLGL